MSTALTLLLFLGLCYVMMRFGCAPFMRHRHTENDRGSEDARSQPNQKASISNRTLISTLVAVVMVLIVVPVLVMLGVMSVGWMGGMMFGMSIAAAVWLLMAIVVCAVLLATVFHQERKA